MFTRVEDTDRTVIDYINLVDVVECELKDDEDLLSDFGNDDHAYELSRGEPGPKNARSNFPHI